MQRNVSHSPQSPQKQGHGQPTLYHGSRRRRSFVIIVYPQKKQKTYQFENKQHVVYKSPFHLHASNAIHQTSLPCARIITETVGEVQNEQWSSRVHDTIKVFTYDQRAFFDFRNLFENFPEEAKLITIRGVYINNSIGQEVSRTHQNNESSSQVQIGVLQSEYYRVSDGNENSSLLDKVESVSLEHLGEMWALKCVSCTHKISHCSVHAD